MELDGEQVFYTSQQNNVVAHTMIQTITPMLEEDNPTITLALKKVCAMLQAAIVGNHKEANP